MDPEKELMEAVGLSSDDEVESDLVDDSIPDHAITSKTDDILEACNWRDTARLRRLAETDGGFIKDDLRQIAWPILLGLPASPDSNETDDQDEKSHAGWETLPRHRDEDQVQLDVNRSFIYYPNQTSAEISKIRHDLSRLIGQVLRRNPYLCYFQGYHDICQVFLLVLPPSTRAPAVARLSALRIRDFMLPSLAPTTVQLRLLPDLLALADPPLRAHIAGIEPYYALAGTLTMYAHNIEGYHDVVRLFDVMLAREPVFTIYIFAQIIIDRRDEILAIDEQDVLQVILGRVPSSMHLDPLIKKACVLFQRYPPEALPSWRRVSSASVLKTARDVDDCASQTLEDGRRYFERQAGEVRWQEMRTRIKRTMWAYRRPAGLIGMAVAVGLLAVHLNRNPSTLRCVLGLYSKLKGARMRG